MVVFPIPSGPTNKRCGKFLSFISCNKRSRIRSLPQIPDKSFGKYFIRQIGISVKNLSLISTLFLD